MIDSKDKSPSGVPPLAEASASTAGRHSAVKILFAVLVISIALVWTAIPLFFTGLPAGGDTVQHLRAANSFRNSIVQGRLLPGWTDENSGMGSPGVRIYPPLSAWVLVSIWRVVGDPYTAFAVSIFAWMLFGCLGTYLFLREFTSAAGSTVGVFLFSVAPHHLLLVFRLFLYSEFVALSIFPYCVMFLVRLIKRGRRVDLMLFSLSCSALSLTHIPLTLIGLIVLVAFAFVCFKPAELWRSIPRLAAAVTFSLSVTLFQLIRVVCEATWIKQTFAAYTNDYFFYGNWLVPLTWFGSTMTTRGLSPQTVDIDALIMISLLLPAIVYVIAAAKRDRDNNFRIVTGLVIAGVVCGFLASRASYYVWSTVSILRNLQFPFRFLSPICFLSAAALSISGSQMVKRPGWEKVLFTGAALFGISAALYFDIRLVGRPSSTDARANFNDVLSGINDERAFEWWLPVWGSSSAFENKAPITVAGRTAEVNEWDTDVREFSVSAGPNAIARIATFYYPFWKGEVNGKTVPLGIDERGAILITVPSEHSLIRLVFEEPLYYKASNYFSAATTALIAISLLFSVLPLKRLRKGGYLGTFSVVRKR